MVGADLNWPAGFFWWSTALRFFANNTKSKIVEQNPDKNFDQWLVFPHYLFSKSATVSRNLE